jgi:hypothetical protein
MKLYRSAVHPGCWVAYVSGSGWVVFPARENGWEERRPARGLDPVHLRQVPLSCAAETGILEPDNELVGVA